MSTEKSLRWMSNIYKDENVYRTFDEMEWENHLKWLEGKIIGDPQATETYTVDQLKAMGMVGVYA